MSTIVNTTPATVDITAQKVDLTAAYQALIAGIKALGVDPLVLGTGGSSITISLADLVAKLQQRVDSATATKDARKALASLVESEKAADATAKPLRAALKRWLIGRLGPNNPDLQKYGYTQIRRPRKPAKAKAQAAVKAKATRATRGTKGRQQRAGVIAPASAPAPAPAPATAPATAPSTSTPGSASR
jgi:hypothetical protein